MSKHLATDIVNKPIKIIIVGLGWLGKELALSLINDGCQVAGTSRSQEKITDFQSRGIDARIYELPASPDVPFPFQEPFDIAVVAIPPNTRGGKELNEFGFRSLSQSLAKVGIHRLILISSTGIYKASNKLILESSELEETSELIKMENCFSNWGDDLSIIRFGGLIGPGRHPAQFFNGGRSIPAPEHPVNFIHQDDCIGIIQCLIENGISGIVLNGVSPHHPSRREFYTQAFEKAGLNPAVFHDDLRQYKLISSEHSDFPYNFIHKDLFILLEKMSLT